MELTIRPLRWDGSLANYTVTCGALLRLGGEGGIERGESEETKRDNSKVCFNFFQAVAQSGISDPDLAGHRVMSLLIVVVPCLFFRSRQGTEFEPDKF